MSEEDIQEYVDRLKECKEYDAESGHIEAWNEVEKWYS